jgi:DNA processing protein
LTLHRAPGIGARILQRLLDRFGNPRQILDAGPGQLRTLGLRQESLNWLANPDRARLDEDLKWLEQPDNHLVCLYSADYPKLLTQISDPPPLLFVCGNLELLHLPQLAIVGSRNSTPGGNKNAKLFARFLATHGLAITSGLAAGIDAAAHRGALEAEGKTIAVMGTGTDRIYPAQHRDLAHAIVNAGGCLLSEFPLGSAPLAGNFPRRNRIISGLSLGVLVVEAALRSGSLISAQQALEQGREVFAIPGSIHNSLARGCHSLIKNGAKLVETAQDIIEELAPLLGSIAPAPSATQPGPAEAETLTEEDAALLQAMGFEPISIDELAMLTGQSVQRISSQLLLLELAGHVSSSVGGTFHRLK